MKKIMITLSLLLMTGFLYSQDNTPNHPATITAAVAANNNTLTAAIVTTLITGAGAAEEDAMFKALLAAYPGQAAMIAETALGCCSDSAVVAIATSAVGNSNIPASSYQNLYNIAVANNAGAAAALTSIFGIKTGGAGGGSLNGDGTRILTPGTTGDKSKQNEGESSP